MVLKVVFDILAQWQTLAKICNQAMHVSFFNNVAMLEI
jgi:hypothetical protein